MGYFSVWPMLAVLAGLFVLAMAPAFRAADTPPIPTHHRVETLDGLRGFLALAVFFHHGALYHDYIRTGLWQPPSDRVFALLGSFGVSMFFMITGFLFWSQLLAKKGRPDWVRLYLGRVFRIGPLYLAAAGAMVAAVFAVTGPHLHGSAIALAVSLLQWLALGLRAGMPINGVEHPGIFLANVTWSLRWEWFFYGSLIFTSVFARNRFSALAFPLAGLAVSMAALIRSDMMGHPGSTAAIIALFSIGMATAAVQRGVPGFTCRTIWASLLSCTLLLTVLAWFPTAYAAAPIALLGGAFFLIAQGATLFGLLETRAAKRLGDVSFGIYLLQGLVLAGLFAPAAVRAFTLQSPLYHWFVLAVAGALLIAVATAAHAWIERPGIALGQRILDGWRRRRMARDSVV